MSRRALIVDDERDECTLLSDALRAHGFESEWTLEPMEALEMTCRRPFDVVLTDLNMPRVNGVQLCRMLKDRVPEVPVVVVTAFGSIDAAVDAMRAGAYDFVVKPFDLDALDLVVRRAAEHCALRREVHALRRVVDGSKGYGALLGTSQAMRDVYALIDRVARTDSPLLITGESGTGKELVAREVHRRSRRSDGPFVPMNCAAVPETLLESELFGHVKGAFTDARTGRDGLLVTANGGSVLLDEIGDMPSGLQPKLLRVLQENRVRPLGASREVPFDVRVIATTNRDLERAIERGTFRQDLYFRLNVMHVEMPPLRARGGDTLLLAQSFLSEIAARNDRKISGFTYEAAERLLAYDWPGNVRELRNCVERALALANGEYIEVSDLPQRVRDYRATHLTIAVDDPSELVPLEEIEKRYILRVVESCKGNKSKAARVLGIGRRTLYRRLESFGVAVDDACDGDTALERQ